MSTLTSAPPGCASGTGDLNRLFPTIGKRKSRTDHATSEAVVLTFAIFVRDRRNGPRARGGAAGAGLRRDLGKRDCGGRARRAPGPDRAFGRRAPCRR